MRKIATLIFAVSLLACNNKKESAEAVEDESLSYTLYSDKCELFVEFKPFVVGNTTHFAAHFTVLGPNFTPLSEAEVTVSLIVDGKGIKQTVSTPEVPGLFKLSLTPKTAGIGTLIFDIRAKTFTDRIFIKNIEVFATKAAIKTLSEPAKPSVAFLKEQAWKVDFANVPAVRQSFSDIIVTSGQILSAPGDEVIVTAGASGIVSFSGIKSTVGNAVNAGTPMFIVSGGNLTERNINSNFNEANANYSKAKADFSRAQELVKDQIISDREFQEIKRSYQNAQTHYNTIAKNYSSKGQSISAPMTGFIKSIAVSEGQFVEPGMPLATISKNKKLILQANVSQKYFDKLSTITSANFKASGTDAIISTESLNGKKVVFGKSAGSSPFIPVTFEIDNTGNLISGSVVEVYLKSMPIPDALVIPASALLEEQGSFYVYVQTAGESFEKREVKLGANDGQIVQVLSGIVEGERVVSKGAYQIKLSAASGTLPAHGHEH